MNVANQILLEVLKPPTSHLMDPGELAHFRTSEPFSEFVEFVMGDRPLIRGILGQNFDLSDPSDRGMFQRVVEMYLLRGLVAVHHSQAKRVESTAAFVDFLELEEVDREVTVPLKYLALEQASYDLGDFGVLQAEEKMPKEIEDKQLFLRQGCLLRFHVKTKKYFGVTEFPLAEQIRNKIAAFRLTSNPFVSYNHFSISHIHPWEEPLRDELFYNRFYGRPLKVISSEPKTPKISWQLADSAHRIYDLCCTKKWNVISPWRLALNRLDEAIFKTESGSPDALLDVVIGLESVLVEPESTQESTHKVAVRAARFLKRSSDARADLFRRIKKLYALRSKIAHGKSLGVDNEAKRLLNEGISLLTEVLRAMLEADQTELDLSLVDLS